MRVISSRNGNDSTAAFLDIPRAYATGTAGTRIYFILFDTNRIRCGSGTRGLRVKPLASSEAIANIDHPDIMAHLGFEYEFRRSVLSTRKGALCSIIRYYMKCSRCLEHNLHRKDRYRCYTVEDCNIKITIIVTSRILSLRESSFMMYFLNITYRSHIPRCLGHHTYMGHN